MKVVLVGLMALVLALFPEACIGKEGGWFCVSSSGNIQNVSIQNVSYHFCTSSCGNIQKVSYPFRIKGDPPQCGDPSYELACESNRTTLYLYGTKYYVQEIYYADNKMRVVDASLDDGSCSILHSSPFPKTSLDCSDPYCLSLSDAVVLINCALPVNSSHYVDFSTSINNSSSSKTYCLYGDVKASDIHEQCSIQVVIPTLSFNNAGGLSIFEIHQQVLKGIELSFSPSCFHIGHIDSFMERVKQSFQILFSTLRYYLFSTPAYHKLFGDLSLPVPNSDAYLHYNYYMAGRDAAYAIKGVVLQRTSLGVLFLIVLLIYKFRQRHLSDDNIIEEFLQSHNNLMPIRYSYSEIKAMTKGFKDKLGQGGFGYVYKGKLRSGHLVAVKVLGTSKANGQDFISEVATIGRIHHVNVVRLSGFCAEGSKRALIYDFMDKGSLDKYIFPKGEKIDPLSWERTYEIGLGVARGIEYLHRGCDKQILHFDIKPHNILLDENYVPKISDFGLAKLYPIDDSIVRLSTARGTQGYTAPEMFYKNIGGISYKADVYSFGMLLMEMVGRRKNVNASVENLSQIYFPSWIYDRISQSENIEFEDAKEVDEKKIAKKMVIVALWCIQLKPVDRPSMSKVLEMLECEVELLQMPPKPFLCPQETSDVDHADNNSRRAPISSRNVINTITIDVM